MQGNRAAQEANYASSLSWARRFNSVSQGQLTAWVSTFRCRLCCSFVGYIPGTFNLNCHIRFCDGVEWIVRFPVLGRAMGDVDAKVRHEVAVMKLIKSRTSIPIPDVIAWGLANTCPLDLGPFIIMEYVEGQVLGRLIEVPGHLPNGKILKDDIDQMVLNHIYKQVARFILELAEIEFASIGTLVEDENNFGVESGPVTVKMNDIERQDGIALRALPKPCETTTEFFEHVLSLEMDHLRVHPASVTDASDARKKFQRLRRLQKILPKFIDPAWDASPFLLRCEGMRFGNMLVDKNFNITAVLDWEWSYAAPKQMFYSPPRWLIVRRPMHWNTRAPWQNACWERYRQCFHMFINILAEEEDIRDKERPTHRGDTKGGRLSRLMSDSLKSGILWFHELLLTPSAYSNDAMWAKVEDLMIRSDRSGEAVDEEEIQEFVDLKMRQLHKFEEQQKNSGDSIESPRKNLVSIGIGEIINSC